MVFFNHVAKQMAAKIVYYGPAFGGKTTNLQYIHAKTAENMRGEMVSLETETDRTIFFDLLPILYGDFQGYQTRFLLYTVPGQVYYNNTRKLVLQGVDGVVFVADSQLMKENVESLKNLQENLAEMDLDLGKVPLVFQYNKRDLKNIHAVAELQKTLNPMKRPYFEATALYGPGVFESLKGLSNLTLEGLQGKLEAPRKGAPPPPSKPVRVEKPARPEKKAPVATKTATRAKVSESTPPSGIKVEFDHEPTRQAKAQKTQVEYTRIALSNPEDIDRELDRLRRVTIQKPTATGERTEELSAATVARAQARAGAAPKDGDKPRTLVMPIAAKDSGKVKSVKLQIILEGEKLSADYKKAFRVVVPTASKSSDGKGAEVGFTVDIRISSGS